MNDSKSAGFTLIELTTVVLLLGVLAGVFAPKFLSLTEDTKASILESIGGSMESGLDLLYAKALTEGQHIGTGSILVNGTTIPLYYGQPSVRGRDSFVQINNQVKAWLEIDAVDRNTARGNRESAQFFTDKSTRNNQIYIFFTEDYDVKGVNYLCHIRYENPESNTPTGPTVTIHTSEC